MMRNLTISSKLTGLTLQPDSEYPQLWRIHYRDRVSDMVNLSRAKDAAISWVRPRGLGGNEIAKWDRRETCDDGPPVPPNAEGVSKEPRA